MLRRDFLAAGMAFSLQPPALSAAERADEHPAGRITDADRGQTLDGMVARAYRNEQALHLPPTRFLTDGIIIPPPGGDEIRGRPFTLLGTGAGEPFAQETFQTGTTIQGNKAAGPVVRFLPRAPRQGIGSIEWGKQRIVGETTSGTPLVQIGGMAGLNHLHDFVLFQNGMGDGLVADSLITSTVQRFFVLNRDWADDGAIRQGVGFRLTPTLDFGLAFVANCTVRGFATAYQVGTDQSQRVLASKLFMPECSVVDDGIRVASSSEGLSVDTPYFEGVTGTCISDKGRATHITNPYAVLAFETGLDLRGTGGCVSGGYIGLRERDAVGVRVGGSPFGQGLFGCQIVWGAAGRGSNVRGLEIAPSGDPLLFAFVGFNPAGAWRGGRKIDDQSYSMAHGGTAAGHGSGVVGFLVRESNAGASLPVLSRGAINLHVDDAILDDGDVDAEGVLRLSAASVQRLHPSRPVTIRRFAASNLPDKSGLLVLEDGAVTFLPSERLLGIAEPLTFARGETGVVHYQVLPGSTAPVMITAIHRSRRTPKLPAFPVAALASIREGISGPVLASDGCRAGEAPGRGSGCPVWFDGQHWRTFYSNEPVRA